MSELEEKLSDVPEEEPAAEITENSVEVEETREAAEPVSPAAEPEASPLESVGAEPEDAEDKAPEAPTAETETDRVSGEYHYKNGYTQRIYSDAHYVPAEENTVPPRYYTPPEKPVREKKPSQSKRFLRVACLALVCALLGGILGAGITAGRLNGRMDALEQKLEEKTVVLGSQTPAASTVSSSNSGSGLSGAKLYDLACEQVVGITTDVTYTNFFGMTTSSAVTGSGFILSEDGYILTNYHVVEYAAAGSNTAYVILHDGTRYEASIVGTEPGNDVAVLKIDASGLSPVAIGNSDLIQVGDLVRAVGNPLGELEFTMTTGYISALDRIITTDESSEPINMFQFDAAVNSGNSGGPLYDADGRVIGIVSAKYASSGVEGLGFAIPINDAMKIAEDLITKGYVTGKAYMGISYDSRYNSMYAQYYGWPEGVYVAEVTAGSAAEKAGIQAGDIITRIGDASISGYAELKQVLKQYSAGDTVELELYRADQSVTLSITFDEARPD